MQRHSMVGQIRPKEPMSTAVIRRTGSILLQQSDE